MRHVGKKRLAAARKILDMHLPPGSMCLSLGRLGLGPWPMSAADRRLEERLAAESLRSCSSPKPKKGGRRARNAAAP